VVLGAAMLLAACSSGPGAPAAAKVNSTRILRSDLDDQLQVLADNTKWLKSVGPQLTGGSGSVSEPNGNVSTTLAAAWLTSLINQAVVDQAFDDKDLQVSEQNKSDARSAADQLFTTDDGNTFDSMPKWFRDQFLAAQGRYEAVKESLGDAAPASDEELQQALDSLKGTYCPSGDAVLNIQVASRQAAEQVVASLAAGQSFDDVHRANDTSQNRSSGGFVTCTGAQNYQQLPENIRQAVDALTVGGVSAPVQSSAGWHVFKRVPFDLANLRPLAELVRDQSTAPPMTKFINGKLRRANVWVDPRYGRLTAGNASVQPPRAPRTRSEPPTTATTQPGP
jgi:parvulin-like peptidyl-prolyl isomerase